MITAQELQTAAAAAWSAAGKACDASPDQRSHDYAASFHALAHSPAMCDAIVAELKRMADARDLERRTRSYEAESTLVEKLANGFELRRRVSQTVLQYGLRDPRVSWVAGRFKPFRAPGSAQTIMAGVTETSPVYDSSVRLRDQFERQAREARQWAESCREAE